MKLRHAMKRALSTVGFMTVASAFVSLPFSFARAEEYVVIDAAEAAQLGAAMGGDEIRKIDNGDATFDIVHLFTSTGNGALDFSSGSAIVANSGTALVIGGGGGGNGNCGGGGGAGGLIDLENLAFTKSTTLTVNVGEGGASVAGNTTNSNNGQPTTFVLDGTTYTANGGGGGGGWTSGGTSDNSAGKAGGSGGGSASATKVGGAATQPTSTSGGLGNKGGNGYNGTIGAGGGGAGSVGGNATTSKAGAGGDGVMRDISGVEAWYAAGGGGGAANNASIANIGGSGVGGNGSSINTTKATAGAANTGSGGGGGAGAASGGDSGAGGSGVVIVRYTVFPHTEVEVNGSVIEFAGAETNWVDGELVLKFTDTALPGVLRLPNYAQAWVLAVGGGGAGANPAGAKNSEGGAGGGGAGGFVEDTAAGLKGGSYTITVGNGGHSPATQGNGQNGEDTVIACGEETIYRAIGGGGGGMVVNGVGGAGQSGGSGGGGSKSTNGGSGTAGQGNDGGGCAAVNRAGGGGGGAGSAGVRATKLNIGGAGGSGKVSEITGLEFIYAAGGGGGSRAGTGGAGGSDGTGGIGGGSANDPGDGLANTGSGGGGGKLNTPGGNGGSGVVIIRIKMVMPEKPVQPEAIPYDGLEHVICAPNEAYVITGTAAATSVGSYSFTVSLKAGYLWGDGTTGDVTINWEITKPKLVVTTFTQDGWQLGERPEKPVLVVTAGEGGPEVALTDDQVSYQYGPSATGPWSGERPNAAGAWYVQAVITGGKDFDAPETAPVAAFQIWDAEASPIEAFGYHARLSVTSYSGAAVADFPMLVRLRENEPQGFRYNQTEPNGAGLRFYAVDDTGAVVLEDGVAKPLPYEVEAWNPDGETAIWVKVPRYEAGQVAVMCWGLVDGYEMPARPATTDVWKDFTAVYHMTETIDELTATTKSKDSTAYKRDATPVAGTNGDVTQMVSTNGVVGTGRVNMLGNSVPASQGNCLNTGIQNMGNVFTVSGWFHMTTANSYQRILGNKNGTNNGGWSIEMRENSSTSFLVRDNAANQEALNVTDLKTDWAYLAFVYDGATVKVYSNGELKWTSTSLSGAGNTPQWLAIGSTYNLSERSFLGRYDEVRVSPKALDAAWILADYLQIREAHATFGPAIVTPEVTLANFWQVEPVAGATNWGTGEEPTMNVGVPAYGAPSYFVITAVGGEAYTNSFPTAAGAYTLVFRADAGTTKPDGTVSWSALATDPIQVNVTAHSPRTDLSGTAGSATLSGRVLLANNEPGTVSPILDQDYNQTKESSPAIYWVHENEDKPLASLLPNVCEGSSHRLVAGTGVAEICGETNIWLLTDVYLGNVYSDRGLTDEANRNRLPNSTTSADSPAKAMHLLMRNLDTAVIYSPCYTNGIGTIYFDAVNGWLRDAGTGYNLVVEVAKGIYPTVDAVPETAWEVVGMKPLKRETAVGPDFVPEPATAELALNITTGQNLDQDFYRVVVPIECHEPARFRIRRTSLVTDVALDRAGFIEIDNIVVSYPAMRADLSSYGWFDSTKGGKQTLGYENAWNVPFPSVTDTLHPRAQVTYYTNPGDLAADVNAFVTAATMHYRWRYLDQQFGEWKMVSLDPTTMTAPDALQLAGADGKVLPGDVEFWYDLVVNAPYYKYVDYAAVDGFRMNNYYSEEVAFVTNRYAGAMLSSQGTDWFVRLREGQSDYEAFDLEVWSPDKDGVFQTTTVGEEEEAEKVPVGVKTIEMELIGNHVWRGYLQTLDPIEKGVRFRIRGRNRQEPGSTDWTDSDELMGLSNPVTMLPSSGVLRDCAETDWTDLPVDATTGYLMVQIDDATKSITIVHADYQNFNGWNDANKGSMLFVGSSTEDNGKAGASPRAVEWNETFDTWLDMPATNIHWQESFTTTTQLEEPDYTTFGSTTTPNGWNAGQGMWVYGYYKDNRTGRALQMEGQGRGYLQFLDGAEAPRGLESISFKARLGQFINFSDFCYYDADNKTTMSNYTFTTRAAFDLNSCQNFTGNASLSLVGYYRPGKGCYEFRYEQAIADWDNNTQKSKGIHNQGQVFSLWRWSYDRNTGKMNRTHLGSITNSAVFKVNNIKTSGVNGTYMPMYLSVSNGTDGATCIMAGVGRTGMAPSAALSGLGTMKWDSLCYRDTTTSRLTSGSYGVLSANCDGVFLQPYQLTKAVPFNGAFTDNNTLNRYTDSKITIDTASPHACVNDIDPEGGDLWYVTPGRMEGFNAGGTQWGLRAKTPKQEVQIFTGTAGKTDWKLLATTNFNSFGTSKACTFNLYTTKDCSVKIAAAGSLDDLRTDLIIDDVELRQWRGDNWENEKEMYNYVPGWTSETDYKAHTNFIFTSAWIKNKALLLSAKRTEPGTACAIRSPLFDGSYGRGTGLGMMSFSFANAQPTARLLLQVATNVTYTTINNINGPEDANWTTVTNFTFVGETSGTRSCYIGLHGVEGAMRLIMDPAVVNAAAASKDPKYGEIYITEAYCRDEPMLDAGCWWGWNLRTLGLDELGRDGEKRMYLPDVTTAISKQGQSLALNNSVTDGTDKRDDQTYIQHPPFVQTPTFTSNVVGEVTFRARKYDGLASSQPAQVTLYGATDGTPAANWKRLAAFAVSNTTYTTYTFKTEPGESYNAFRLGVTGVAGVTDTKMDNRAPEGFDTPVRVLIDEVLVSEAVRARVAFRNVGAFRTDLSGTKAVGGVPSEGQQPLCNESWGVQCEVYAAQLPDEIDFERQPMVRLHWFENDIPWGFENWKGRAGAKSAWLAPATGTNLVFRSSYVTAPDAVISPSSASGSVVQYMLEVVYYQVGATKPMTNYLSQADWTNPRWYKPVDHNRSKDAFAAYSILDTVAPHWAWINEVNLFGDYDYNYYNTDNAYQFIEVAVPAEADITGWKVELVEGDNNTGLVVTNTLGIFGDRDLAGTKKNLLNAASNMVFRVLANAEAKKKGNLKVDDGTLDGVWNIQNPTLTVSREGEISGMDPIGLRLVRASGVVEHEVVTIGTNWWAKYDFYADYYHPTNTVNTLNKLMPGSDFLYIGNDDGGVPASLGVVNESGQTSNVWVNVMGHTPGRINEGQVIDPDHPTPNGSSIIVYCNLDSTLGHIYQTVGDAVETNASQILVIQKGSARGTNITYRVDPWFELGTVTTNGRPALATALPEPRTYTVNVGAGASNNVTVVASAKIKDSLLGLGLTEDNRYRNAVVDWLVNHKDAYGRDWANPDADEVQLADFMALSGAVITNMTLTEMYWLDMDPTVGHLALKAGMAEPPLPAIVEGYQGSAAVTNLKMGVFMQITNRTEDAASPYYGQAWTPYIMRGLEPGSTSWDYAADGEWGWTNATFKITGILANGLTHESNANNWIPLRWFVFHEDSFDPDTYISRIEVKDPFGTESPGYSAGWYDWVREHGKVPVFFRWAIDTRLKPFNVEVLKKENYYEN